MPFSIVVFTKKNYTPQFNLVNRSQYGNRCDFKHEIIQYRSNKGFIPTERYCFIKRIIFLTSGDYKEQYLEFTRNVKSWSNNMTMARIQPFWRANNIIMGYFCGIRVFPRSVRDRNNALFLHHNQFCLYWKSENVSCIQAIKELEDNFKIVDNFIKEENVNSHFKYEFIPKKIDSHLTNCNVYDLETPNTDKARPYCISFYRLSKRAGRCNRYLSQYELEKCENDTLLFDGDDCIIKAIDFFIEIQRRRTQS